MHLLAAISPHGFGHLAQSAAVLNALRARQPGLRLTLRTALSRAVLERRIDGPFELQVATDDFGMVQHNALEVDVEASAQRYAEFHRQWDERVEHVAGELRSAAPDLVLADIPYLTLAGASRAGLPSVAMCCLNWADIYRHYCADRPEAGRILEQIETAYRGADVFLRTAPSMPMVFLDNARDIGPIMASGRNRRSELDRAFNTGGEKFVLVAVGGIHLRLPVEQWPRIEGVRWLVQRDWQVEHPDAITIEDLNLPFADLVASCDLLITKPGYGSFTEAAANGIPVFYLPRPGWPESPYLEQWLRKNGSAESLSPEAWNSNSFRQAVLRSLQAGRHTPVSATGIDQAVDELEQRIAIDL
ncbi:glycosyltransferase family protein [Thiohalomonas denitrificans]|uniref:UDP:flavonoid glycosyltransferase YjiC, YdhE family n=1 Tax=Thiohalomonas denitrificans TaxID=415747 RepID=A0A1G5Q8B7_9GAMM|nr:hypothetical protein [Thiohalomonas denitrificans]SCZ58125.1 hypothetical protein SAMN03097708_01611 [Thiohalomonas denitrificans]